VYSHEENELAARGSGYYVLVFTCTYPASAMTIRRTRLYWPSLSRRIAKGRSRRYPDPERTKYRTKELLARTSGEIEYERTEPTCSPLSERETSYQYVTQEDETAYQYVDPKVASARRDDTRYVGTP